MAENQQHVFYYSAPGKTIISGEHSVVYYKNALVMAIDLRTFCKLKLTKEQSQKNPFLTIENKQDAQTHIQINAESLQDILGYILESSTEIEFSVLQKQFPLVEEKQLILSYLFLAIYNKISGSELQKDEKIKKFNEIIASNYHVDINVHSTLPISKGLGSSASYFTALSASITKLFMHLQNVQEIKEGFQTFVNSIAFTFEKIYHGTPSGIDNYIATYGNLLVFNKNHTSSIKINNLPYKIFLIDSQVEKSTKKAVGRVREIYEDQAYGSVGKQSIDMIGQVTDLIVEVVNKEHFDQQKFENLIRMNQSLLRLVDVSHAAIENIMGICMKYDIAAKITGAGQGGNCIAFVPETINQAKEMEFITELESQGYEIIFAKLSVDGVREEKSD